MSRGDKCRDSVAYSLFSRVDMCSKLKAIKEKVQRISRSNQLGVFPFVNDTFASDNSGLETRVLLKDASQPYCTWRS